MGVFHVFFYVFPWFSYVFVHGFSHVFSIRFPDQPSVIQQRGTKRRSIKRLGGHQPMVSGLQVSAKHLTEFFGVLWGYGDIGWESDLENLGEF